MSGFKNTSAPWIEKDAADNLDYSFNWPTWLEGDEIVTSVWSVPTGLTAGNASNSTTKTTQWISGGTAGASYTVTNTITTAAGRTKKKKFTVKVT